LTNTQTLEANKLVARRFARALESGIEADLTDVLGDDVTWKVPQLAPLSREESIAAIKRMVDGANVRVLTEVGITAEANRVAVQWNYRMELKDGSTYDNDYHNLFVIENGKIVFMQSYLDTAYARSSTQVRGLIDCAKNPA
jgi:ketosteroid isomerase-like protein